MIVYAKGGREIKISLPPLFVRQLFYCIHCNSIYWDFSYFVSIIGFAESNGTARCKPFGEIQLTQNVGAFRIAVVAPQMWQTPTPSSVAARAMFCMIIAALE